MNLSIRSFRLCDERIEALGIPFFFKQWGGFFKKRRGRLLEGRDRNL